MPREIVVGTRDSTLALIQTYWVIEKLKILNPGYSFRVLKIKTKGDKILDVALSKIGDKGLFTKELELGLINKEIDLAVHSMKDVPTILPDGLTIGAVCERINSSDVIISPKGLMLNQLPKGAKIGTSSLRRASQLLNYRADFDIQSLRGNINTRLAKLESEGFDAIVLAAAGLIRMGWQDKITEYIPDEICLPAVGQGSLGLEVRKDNDEVFDIVHKSNHPPSEASIIAERSMLRSLEGGCQIPIGALGQVNQNILKLKGMIASPDGKQLLKAEVSGPVKNAELLGQKLADILLGMGGKEILNRLRLGNSK